MEHARLRGVHGEAPVGGGGGGRWKEQITFRAGERGYPGKRGEGDSLASRARRHYLNWKVLNSTIIVTC